MSLSSQRQSFDYGNLSLSYISYGSRKSFLHNIRWADAGMSLSSKIFSCLFCPSISRGYVSDSLNLFMVG
jgi:hypothetical protein